MPRWVYLFVSSKPKKNEKERKNNSVDSLENQHFDDNNPLIQEVS